MVSKVRKTLRHVRFTWQPKRFLDTGSPELNAVLGDPEKGLAYGKILEISGRPSNGKSLLAMDLMAAAQADGAIGTWVDAENSYDAEWMQKRGVDTEALNLVEPIVGTFGSAKETRLIAGEEMLEEAEHVMSLVHQKFPDHPQFMVVDSVAALLMEDEAAAGITGQNLNTTQALPKMLSKLCRRWVGLMQVYNCTTVFVNQLRDKPMAWGDPSYSPGGNAIPFYAHIRVRIRRPSKSRLMKNGKMVGIRGILRNDKNKAGGLEGAECGFKMYLDGRSKFVPKEDIEDKTS